MAATRWLALGRPVHALAARAVVLLVACLAYGGTGSGQGARPADHVVLISVDGLRPDYYLPTQARAVRTPALDALRARGSWAEAVIGQYPSLTYPSHASIATGVRPVRHGVAQNTRFDPAAGSSAWIFEASALKTPAIWDAARAAGLTTAAVSWPVTVGAAIDQLIPETHQAPPNSTWLDLARRESTPGLVDAVVARLGGFGPNDNRDPVERDRFAATAAAHILETHRPNLLLVHLVETDYAQHAAGPGTETALAAVARVDARIGEIIRAIEQAGIAGRTAVVVTGDHGFYRVHSAFQPNVVLREAGLLEVDQAGRVVRWRAIAHRSAIRIADPSDAALARRVEGLFEELAEGRYRGLFRVVGREQIASLGGDPDVLLILEPVEGYTTAAGFDGGFLVPAGRGGDHGYLPTMPAMYTGLILAGAGIRRGTTIPLARQVDIAPTIARLLGFELRGVDGVPMVGVLDEGAARTEPAAAAARRF